MDEYILTTNNLCKFFGKKRAVDNVSMHIKKGTIYGFIGRNGAGKTTFMKMIASLIKPTSGDFTLLGCKGNDLSNVRPRVGCLIEAPGIYSNLSGFDVLKMKCLAMGCYEKSYVEHLLAEVGLLLCKDMKSGRYSLGMKQRLGIALALVGNPDLLILDEPVNGLDPQGMADIRNLLHRLAFQEGKTILISSHILTELAKVATHFGIIDNGKLINEFTSEEIVENAGVTLEIKVNDIPKAKSIIDQLGYTSKIKMDDGTIVVSDRTEESAEINEALVKAGIKVRELSIVRADIEEFYLNISGGEIHA